MRSATTWRSGFIKGLKLYPGYEPFYPNDTRLKVVYDMACEFDVPVMFHSGDTYSPTGRIKYSHPIHIDDLAVDHPDMKIVICHVGNPWIKDCMEVVYKNNNVYADFSGLVLGDFSDKFEKFMKSELENMITYAGNPRYLLYGTDWPISNMGSYLKFINQLDLPEDRKEMILWQNAAKLFKIDVIEVQPLPEGHDQEEGRSPCSWLVRSAQQAEVPIAHGDVDLLEGDRIHPEEGAAEQPEHVRTHGSVNRDLQVDRSGRIEVSIDHDHERSVGVLIDEMGARSGSRPFHDELAIPAIVRDVTDRVVVGDRIGSDRCDVASVELVGGSILSISGHHESGLVSTLRLTVTENMVTHLDDATGHGWKRHVQR